VDSRSLPLDTLSADLTALGQDQCADDRQPQPGPACLAVAGGIGAVEAIEDQRQLLRSDARTTVMHCARHSGLALPGPVGLMPRISTLTVAPGGL
jgi:hypothetical protein